MQHIFDKDHQLVSCRMPLFIFRYQRVDEKFFAALKESYLWFSRPTALNDPLDCADMLTRQYGLKELTEFWLKYIDRDPKRAKEEAKKVYQSGRAEQISKQIYSLRVVQVNVCCFSASPLVNLLWSHYADGHRGAVLIFAAPRLAIETQKEAVRFSIIKTKYQRVLPKYNAFREMVTYGDSAEYNFRFDQIVLGTKRIEWAYEKETRLISWTSGKNYFEPNALVGVILGHKMPADVMSEVRYQTHMYFPEAEVFSQHMDEKTGIISVPGTELFEAESVEIKTSGWSTTGPDRVTLLDVT